MIKSVHKRLLYLFHNPDYRFFMVSLVLLIILPPLSKFLPVGGIILEITFGLVIYLGAIFTPRNIKGFVGSLIIGSVIYIWYLVDIDIGLLDVSISLLAFAYFIFIFWNLLMYLIKSDEVNENTILACISGYLVLGIIAAPFFLIIDGSMPDAFDPEKPLELYDHIYFSFITMTTVGYGDITPQNQLAKSFAIILGLSGQMYMTILTALIIGKFLKGDGIK